MGKNNLNELENAVDENHLEEYESPSNLDKDGLDYEGLGLDKEKVDSTMGDKKNDIEQKIKKIERKLESQKDLYLRLAAEYDNYRKRTERDRLLIYGDAVTNTVTSILPIADSLDAAVKSFSDAPEEYKKGISLLVSQLNTSFKNLEIESFGAKGDTFNPQDYEAISHIDDESLAENVVVEVLRKGYKLKGKVVRCAMVKVAN